MHATADLDPGRARVIQAVVQTAFFPLIKDGDATEERERKGKCELFAQRSIARNKTVDLVPV